jgi:hypothetical protein
MTERKFTPFEDNGIQDYVTRDGREAKVCVATCESSLERTLLIKGYIRNRDGVWVAMYWLVDGLGKYHKDYDLFDVPVKHTGWVNIYCRTGGKYTITGDFDSKQVANKVAQRGRVACVEVTFEEGEGL